MSLYDNEIYRGPPESDPTLSKDTFPYRAEFYIVKPPQTTAQQDVPPTEESFQWENRPTPKKKSRIAKAMKLLTSCVATAAVVTTLAAPAKPVPEPVPELPLFPQIGPLTDGYTYDWISQNSVDCQVSTDHKSYRLTAQQEGIYLTWDRGFYTYFNVDMMMPAEGLDMYLYFDTDPSTIEDKKAEYADMYTYFSPTFGTGQIQTVSGDTLYVLGMLWGGQTKEELPPAQQIIDHLGEYIQISDATPDGWDNILIGDTMYLKISPYWTGTIGSKREDFGWFSLEAVHTSADASYSENDLICQRLVNGIDWSFYYGEDHLIWAVPTQEDIALGYDYIMGGYVLKAQEEMYNTGSLHTAMIDEYGGVVRQTWQDMLVYAVDNVIIEYILSNYYPVEQMSDTEATIKTPAEITVEDVPETPSQCEANGHTWVDANHQAPKTCSVCGMTEGTPLLPAFAAHGLPINITELGKEYDYLTSSAHDPGIKTWGKLSITNYRVFDGDAEHPALDGYQWHTVSVKIRFDDNVALYAGMSFHDCIENYYDIEGWDATQTYLEEINMTQYGCKVNGTDYSQCLYQRANVEWSGWATNPETGVSECSVTFDQYMRLPVGYDGVVFGYYDGGTVWGEGQYIYDIADVNTLFFRLDGTGAQ